ncbi:MAG: transglutaminase-like domain-containing protein [Algiphilus sp.]|nr:transglutaminase-like domain-containing protein [Algiphilus sp.]
MSAVPPAPPEALRATDYLDAEHPEVAAFAARHAGTASSDRARAVALYFAVRDGLRYDPYGIDLAPDAMRASAVLASGRGFCVTKAVVYAAALRAVGIGARIGFADVRNHISSPRLREAMGTDLFRYHGYTEVWLDGRWIKATPAFNRSLCEKAGTHPLDFDGHSDSIFHAFDTQGRQHMEYVADHGPRWDLPYEEVMAAYRRAYPRMMGVGERALDGDFSAEVGTAPH